MGRSLPRGFKKIKTGSIVFRMLMVLDLKSSVYHSERFGTKGAYHGACTHDVQIELGVAGGNDIIVHFSRFFSEVAMDCT